MLPASHLLSPRWFHKVCFHKYFCVHVDFCGIHNQVNVFMIRFSTKWWLCCTTNWFFRRLTSFPILLLIAWYERQSKYYGSSSFYDTVREAAEKVYDTLPRQIKRLSERSSKSQMFALIWHLVAIFEGLAGADADIDAVNQNFLARVLRYLLALKDFWNWGWAQQCSCSGHRGLRKSSFHRWIASASWLAEIKWTIAHLFTLK